MDPGKMSSYFCVRKLRFVIGHPDFCLVLTVFKVLKWAHSKAPNANKAWLPNDYPSLITFEQPDTKPIFQIERKKTLLFWPRQTRKGPPRLRQFRGSFRGLRFPFKSFFEFIP